MSEPLFVSLLFADRVIEEINHKKTIVGTFTTFNAENFPAMFPPWFIYAAATNIQPEEEHNYTLNVANRDTQAVVLSANQKFGTSERGVVAEFIIPAANVVFPTEGTYLVEFRIDGRELITRTLEVRKREKTAGGS
jgi:hypothetical protein